MPDGLDITIRGRAKLMRKARRAGIELDDLRPVNRRAADLIAPEARRRAPHRSGATRRGIKMSVTKRKAAITSGTTGPSKRYAARQHWHLQRGLAGFQYVFKAVGSKGYQAAALYYDWAATQVRKMNRG